jgi:succinate-semialdehyde dehydrogenase / glutarate-semialdehyde dehydrogenase
VRVIPRCTARPHETFRMLQSPLLPHVHGYIGGAWRAPASGKTFRVINPANGDELAQVGAYGEAEIRDAIAAARTALRTPSTFEQRHAWLTGIAAALKDNREEIGRILSSEHGKPWKEGAGEADYAAGFFSYCADHLDLLRPRTLAEKPRGCEWTVRYRPAGVVGLIVPWNFPIGMIAKKLSAAIAADCASVIKPASKTPLTMIALFTLLDRVVKLPPGRANLVMGSAGMIGDTLLTHPDVAVVSFTGSTEVGRELIEKSAPQVKRLTLELGGNAPFIVFEDADLDLAADQLMASKFRGNGQTCVCANRVYVQRSVADAYVAKVAERVARLKLGDPLDPDTTLGPLVDRAGYEKVRRHVEDAVAKGAKLVTGGNAPPLDKEWGGFHPPTVVRGVTRDMECWREETFGPLAPIAEFDTEDEVLAMANDTEFGLAAYVFTRDGARAERAINALTFQHVGWNTGSGPTPEAPFGGMKQSGFGREGGAEGIYEFAEAQTTPRGA